MYRTWCERLQLTFKGHLKDDKSIIVRFRTVTPIYIASHLFRQDNNRIKNKEIHGS